MARKTVKAKLKPAPAFRSDKAALLRQTFRRFTEEEVMPRAREIDEAQALPADLWLELGRMGAFGIRYPKEKGGAGGNNTLYCIICEELARGLVSLAAVYAMQALMGTNFIFHYGDETQLERYFTPAMRGEVFSAFCLTEPDYSSDLTGCQTTAARDGESWVINGMKTWITSRRATWWT